MRAFFHVSPPPLRGGWRVCRRAAFMSVRRNFSRNVSQRTTEALQTLRGHSATLANVVRTQFVDNTCNGHGVGEKLRSLSHLPVLVQRIEVSSVQVRVPTCHVHENLFDLRLCELEFLKESPTAQIMIVLIRLAQHIADLQMRFVIVRPMFFAAVDRYPTIRALEVDVGWWGASLRGLASLEIHFILWGACRLVVRMRAVRMLAHESRSLANLRYRRLRERVEELVFRQDKSPLVALRINVLERFERLLKTAIRRGRERSSRGHQLWLCWTFGGMISLRRDILGERTERLGGPQRST